jgi:hypothetical protein
MIVAARLSSRDRTIKKTGAGLGGAATTRRFLSAELGGVSWEAAARNQGCLVASRVLGLSSVICHSEPKARTLTAPRGLPGGYPTQATGTLLEDLGGTRMY